MSLGRHCRNPWDQLSFKRRGVETCCNPLLLRGKKKEKAAWGWKKTPYNGPGGIEPETCLPPGRLGRPRQRMEGGSDWVPGGGRNRWWVTKPSVGGDFSKGTSVLYQDNSTGGKRPPQENWSVNRGKKMLLAGFHRGKSRLEEMRP